MRHAIVSSARHSYQPDQCLFPSQTSYSYRLVNTTFECEQDQKQTSSARGLGWEQGAFSRQHEGVWDVEGPFCASAVLMLHHFYGLCEYLEDIQFPLCEIVSVQEHHMAQRGETVGQENSHLGSVPSSTNELLVISKLLR